MSDNRTARIDGVLYEWSELSTLTQEILETLSFIDRKISEFDNEKRIFELARSNFLSALKDNLPDDHEDRRANEDQDIKSDLETKTSHEFGDIDLSKVIE